MDLIQLIPTAELSAAIVAVRTAGWPPAQSRTPDMLTGTTDTALTVSSMLERESPRHVADFLRYAEAGITGQAMRSIESVLPEATRAIEAYRELTAASDSPTIVEPVDRRIARFARLYSVARSLAVAFG